MSSSSSPPDPENLSTFQKEFASDTPLVMGSLYGLRSMYVVRTGDQTALSGHWDQEWEPDWNTAICKRDCTRFVHNSCFDYDCDHVIRCRTAPGDGCSCGFYAYWDFPYDHSFQGNELQIWIVVEAAGKIQLGSKGFKAERARIKAIYYPLSFNSSEVHVSIAHSVVSHYNVHPYQNLTAFRSENPLTDPSSLSHLISQQ